MSEEEQPEIPEIEPKPKETTAKLDAEQIEREVMGEHIPAGDSPAPESVGIDGPELWQSLWSVAFSVIAGRRGQHWALSNEEAAELGKATDPVVEKYMPDAKKGGPEMTLLIVGLMVIGPRAAMDKAQPATGAGDGGQE